MAKQGNERRRDFDDSNDNQSGSRAWERGTGARAENLDSFERHSVALNGRHGTVFVIRRRTVIDNLERRGLTNPINFGLRIQSILGNHFPAASSTTYASRISADVSSRAAGMI